MPKPDALAPVFTKLKQIVRPLAKQMQVVADTPAKYLLEGGYSEQLKKRIWFGGVQRGKAYVSYHLIAVYAFPDLLKGVSPKLRARMQGKSCFNFRKVDPPLFRELERLTRKSFQRFKKEKWVSSDRA